MNEHEPIDLSEALERISEIHEQIAKGEVYRGCRSLPMAISGVCGLMAALAQHLMVPAGDLAGFLHYWVTVGAICFLVASSEIAWFYIFRSDSTERRRTRHVVGQFIPSLLAGAAIAIALGQSQQLIPFLPGLWAVCFSMGVFASRPYLPRASGWVGLYYLCAGTLLLVASVKGTAIPLAWQVGGVFGVGQLASALVLYWNLERENGTEEDC